MPKIHPIYKAIEGHLGIITIHPYKDGNGRISRLVQDFTLHKHGYPPAKIDVTEREIYVRLVERAREDREQRLSYIDQPSKDESIFHDYICSKILKSVSEMESELDSKRAFDVTISGKKVDKKMLRNIIGSVRRIGRRGTSIKITQDRDYQDKKGARFRVEGDMNRDQLETILESRDEFLDSSLNYEVGKVTGEYKQIAKDDSFWE